MSEEPLLRCLIARGWVIVSSLMGWISIFLSYALLVWVRVLVDLQEPPQTQLLVYALFLIGAVMYFVGGVFELIQMARLFSGTTLLVSVVAIITVSPWLDDAIYFFCDSTEDVIICGQLSLIIGAVLMCTWHLLHGVDDTTEAAEFHNLDSTC